MDLKGLFQDISYYYIFPSEISFFLIRKESKVKLLFLEKGKKKGKRVHEYMQKHKYSYYVDPYTFTMGPRRFCIFPFLPAQNYFTK